jgi:hypothetical protein
MKVTSKTAPQLPMHQAILGHAQFACNAAQKDGKTGRKSFFRPVFSAFRLTS